MENGKSQSLAEKIALLLQQETATGSDDFSILRAGLEKINQRLDKIEAQIAPQNPKSETPNHQSIHPSQDKFLNLEELADQIIKNFPNEKACPYEPTGKACDHCSMCNSRGF